MTTDIRQNIVNMLPKYPHDDLIGDHSATAEGISERLGKSHGYIRHIMADMTNEGKLGFVVAYPYKNGKHVTRQLRGRCKMRCYYARV